MTRSQASQKAREARAVSQEAERKKLTRKALVFAFREIPPRFSKRQGLRDLIFEMRTILDYYEKLLHDSEPD